MSCLQHVAYYEPHVQCRWEGADSMARQQLLMDWRTFLNTLKNMMKIVVALAPATTADLKVTFTMLALPFGGPWYMHVGYIASTCHLMRSGLSSQSAAFDWLFVTACSSANCLVCAGYAQDARCCQEQDGTGFERLSQYAAAGRRPRAGTGMSTAYIHICTFFGSACMLINDIPAQ